MRIPFAVILSVPLLAASFALAQEAPSPEAGKLSRIVTAVEARQDFKYIDQINFSNGNYRVVFFMTDGAEVRIEYDADTGEPVPVTTAAPTE